MNRIATNSAGGAQICRDRIALVSMPWHDPYIPSIQLGALKAYVDTTCPGIQVDTLHAYFILEERLGLTLSNSISEHGGLFAESMFAYHLFPSKRPEILAYVESWRYRNGHFAREIDFLGDVIEPIGAAVLSYSESIDWSKYSLVGFSLVYAQTMASLLLAASIKANAPNVLCVFGGPSCTGELGRSLLENFPQIDAVVNGEGEEPLAQLACSIAAGETNKLGTIRGVRIRSSDAATPPDVNEMASIERLPPPDYRLYFETIRGTVTHQIVRPKVFLPIESSRGCWWDRSLRDPLLSCSFCNLNVQWKRYREKPVDRFVEEVERLSREFDVDRFFLVDNILRYTNVEDLCESLKALGRMFTWGVEARVSVKPAQLLRLREAGALYVQFGIEALSTQILKVINKGTTCLQNIQALKFAERFGMLSTSNLISDHPAVAPSAIRETLENIQFVSCYRPLNVSRFVLGYGSPVYKFPGKFGISNVRNLDDLRRCLPDEICSNIVWLEQSFDVAEPPSVRELWEAVRCEVEQWKGMYKEQCRRYGVDTLLLFTDYPESRSLEITDYRTNPPGVFKLADEMRELYLAADTIISIDELCEMTPTLTHSDVASHIEWMVMNHLMFREGKKCLSLAIPAGREERMRLTPGPETRKMA